MNDVFCNVPVLSPCICMCFHGFLSMHCYELCVGGRYHVLSGIVMYCYVSLCLAHVAVYCCVMHCIVLCCCDLLYIFLVVCSYVWFRLIAHCKALLCILVHGSYSLLRLVMNC